MYLFSTFSGPAAQPSRPAAGGRARLGWLLLLLVSLGAMPKAWAQAGLLNDDFAATPAPSWVVPNAGASGSIVNGKFVVTPVLANATNNYYRGDFQRTGGATLHAGTYPIIAVKFSKPPRCNWFFDTNLGSYNNGNNNSTKLETGTEDVYYWDLSTGRLGTTTLSTTQPTVLSLFQFKLAEISYTQAQLAANDLKYSVSWVKSFASVADLRTAVGLAATPATPINFTGSFVHPGILHSTADLTRIKNQVDNQFGRAYASYQLLLASSRASATYAKAGPYQYITRDATLTINTPTGSVNGGAAKNGVESDCMAAYYNALRWTITGNVAHAQKAAEILDAYANYTVGIQGTDAELNGLIGFMFANAAEILRATYPAWPAASVTNCQNMLKNVFYPTLQNFKPCAHGNWDIICMKALLAIAVFSDDNAMFNRAANYYYTGEGNGSIINYVLTADGQLEESNRDQPHTMLALGSLAEIGEIGVNQGIDFYGASNNAIMRGYEYTSRYNLGNTVPYTTAYDYCERNYTDQTPEAISPNGRGDFRPVFEIAYNHYVFRRGLAMPFTLQVLGRGPEGAPPGADNPGYGSLLFYLNPQPDYPVTTNPVNPNVGLIDDNFTNSLDGWVPVTAGSTAAYANGVMTVTLPQPTGNKRGDIRKTGGVVLYPTNFPFVAIKMTKPAVVNVTLDTNLGSYGNGANRWTGRIGTDVYYYDLRLVGFGAGPTFLSTTAPTALSTFQFKVADISSGETSYTVDWVKTARSLAELNDIVNNRATWLGTTSNDASVATNWSPAAVPTASIDVTIPGTAPQQPTASTAQAMRSLTLGSGAALTTSAALTLTGDLTNNGGTLTGPVALAGAATQTIGGSAPTTFQNLTVGAAGAALSSPASISQVLTLNGNLTTNGQPLTLLSDATGTALLVNNGSASVVGAGTMQRYIDPTPNPATGTGTNPTGLGYRHYSSPVQSTTVADLATANFTPLAANSGVFPTVYSYDQSRVTAAANTFDAGWVAPASTATPLVVGQGYTVNLPATALVDFVGTFNNGPLNLTLNCGAPSEAGWNFLGNPYPAPLDWNTVTVPAGVGGAVYLNTSNSQYGSSYRSFVNNVGTSELIPAGQGFFLRATVPGTSPVLALSNANRATTFGPQTAFQRPTETRPLVQLQLSGAGTSTDDAYVYFEQGATASFDARYDAAKLLNSGMGAVNVYSVAGADKLSINGLPLPGTQAAVVPLGVSVTQPGTYTLRAEQLLNQPGSVSLHDLLTGNLTPLAAGTSYSFAVAAGATATGRFELLFGPQKALGTASVALSQQVALFPNPAHGEVQLSLPASLQHESLRATVLNALGQLVVSRVLPAGAALRTLPLTGLAMGVYSVRLETSAGIVTKRLICQ
ncbi:DUF4979 domain-containing protein [Hymenobacter daeguensis]